MRLQSAYGKASYGVETMDKHPHEDRFMRFVTMTPSCWLWTGTKDHDGYGQFSIFHQQYRAHRVAYEIAYGPMPLGLVIDHLCRNRGCVNPCHLELVTPLENVLRSEGITAVNLRKTHCVNGHPLFGENVRPWKGHRLCKACDRKRGDEYRRRLGQKPRKVAL
jgi:hypothetical protein